MRRQSPDNLGDDVPTGVAEAQIGKPRDSREVISRHPRIPESARSAKDIDIAAAVDRLDVPLFKALGNGG
jgi:hypothetical protein